MQLDAVRRDTPLTMQEVKEDDPADRRRPRKVAIRVTDRAFCREKAALRELHRPAMLSATRASQVGKLNDHRRGRVVRLAHDEVNVTVGLELCGDQSGTYRNGDLLCLGSCAELCRRRQGD